MKTSTNHDPGAPQSNDDVIPNFIANQVRLRVMSRKAVAIGRPGLDTGYGWDVSLFGLVDEHL